MTDIVKINDETGCGGFHGYTDINDPALDEFRDWINFHIRMMESMNASKMTLTVGENVEL
ncbi:hypothetical protein [Segatella sp.]|uniref:hypothetical protein n=1 Tax=Segatella sp. TaxID=2974253 RepID=UPI003AAEC295